MVGSLKNGDHIGQTHIRFRTITVFEQNINAIDQDYESEDAIFNSYVYKLNTPQFFGVNRSPFGNGCDFKHEIIEYRGNNKNIPTKGFCFIKCNIFLIGKDYKQQKLNFIRNGDRRSNFMTRDRIQPCLRKLGVNLG